MKLMISPFSIYLLQQDKRPIFLFSLPLSCSMINVHPIEQLGRPSSATAAKLVKRDTENNGTTIDVIPKIQKLRHDRFNIISSSFVEMP